MPIEAATSVMGTRVAARAIWSAVSCGASVMGSPRVGGCAGAGEPDCNAAPLRERRWRGVSPGQRGLAGAGNQSAGTGPWRGPHTSRLSARTTQRRGRISSNGSRPPPAKI